MNDTRQIHHINYEYNPRGLTPAQCTEHGEKVRTALARHFGIAPMTVRVNATSKAESIDVRVMRAAGSTPDYDPNQGAMKQRVGILAGRPSKPTQRRVVRPPFGSSEFVLRLAKPRNSEGSRG
jgi:hypothetical protein